VVVCVNVLVDLLLLVLVLVPDSNGFLALPDLLTASTFRPNE